MHDVRIVILGFRISLVHFQKFIRATDSSSHFVTRSSTLFVAKSARSIVKVTHVWLICFSVQMRVSRSDRFPFDEGVERWYRVFRSCRPISISFHRDIYEPARAANNNIKFECARGNGHGEDLCKHVTGCRVTPGKSNRRWKRDKSASLPRDAPRLDLEFRPTFELIKTQIPSHARDAWEKILNFFVSPCALSLPRREGRAEESYPASVSGIPNSPSEFSNSSLTSNLELTHGLISRLCVFLYESIIKITKQIGIVKRHI